MKCGVSFSHLLLQPIHCFVHIIALIGDNECGFVENNPTKSEGTRLKSLQPAANKSPVSHMSVTLTVWDAGEPGTKMLGFIAFPTSI